MNTDICRRCGLPRDENHVPSPYFCERNPDRVHAVFSRATFKVVQSPERTTRLATRKD